MKQLNFIYYRHSFPKFFFSADQLILSALTEYNFELYQLENDQYQDQDQDFRRGLRSG